MSKKKRKLKKFLKGAALLGAAGLGAAALGRRKQNKTFLAEEGGARSILPQAKRMMNVAGKLAIPVDVNANPREIDALVRSYGINTREDNFGLPTPKASIMASPGLNTGAFDIGMKKGGRVKKTKFSTKKKKQANKMRKK